MLSVHGPSLFPIHRRHHIRSNIKVLWSAHLNPISKWLNSKLHQENHCCDSNQSEQMWCITSSNKKIVYVCVCGEGGICGGWKGMEYRGKEGYCLNWDLNPHLLDPYVSVITTWPCYLCIWLRRCFNYVLLFLYENSHMDTHTHGR